jgi:thymidylate synthase
MLEIVGANFLANEPLIFGEVNEAYVERELKWYLSMSRDVNDIPGGPPAIWTQISSKGIKGPRGLINSNYGWMILSKDNHCQYFNVLQELVSNPFSRRALMIYQRPSMHDEYNADGMSDFVCTNAAQYLIRDGFLDTVVQMRSNDIWAGYRNDRAWQVFVRDNLLHDLNNSRKARNLFEYQAGDIFWQVGSLHTYEKDFYLIDNFERTGQTSIKKSEYKGKWK